jgi:adenylate cyclase
MPTEIERKFLVSGSDWRTANAQRISQGYLNRDKNRTVRVRVAGAKAYLTIKGATTGASRAEFEYEIPLEDAQSLLRLCDGPLLEKLRHRIEYQGLTWEVDEFLGENAGLVVAEVELTSEDQVFSRPPWIGREVTSDARYYNSNLASTPYSQWGHQG